MNRLAIALLLTFLIAIVAGCSGGSSETAASALPTAKMPPASDKLPMDSDKG